MCGHKEPTMLNFYRHLKLLPNKPRILTINNAHFLEDLSLTWPMGYVHHTLVCGCCKMVKIASTAMILHAFLMIFLLRTYIYSQVESVTQPR